MASEYIKKVTESDFEYEVVAYSKQVPVIVDFWAEWCRPCKALTPILEKIAEENRGSFRLAEVNVDDSPNLALRYSVRSIPNVKAFRDGQVVSEFLGQQPENRVKDFIRNIAPSQIDLLLEKGQSMLENLNWKEASAVFQQYLVKSVDNPGGLLGLLKAYLMLGKYPEAKKIIAEFPASVQYASVQVLQPLLEVLSTVNNNETEDSLEAAFRNAIQLIKRGNVPAAMDGLIDILRLDKHYANDGVRKVLLGLFEILGSYHPLTEQYRKELALVLF